MHKYIFTLSSPFVPVDLKSSLGHHAKHYRDPDKVSDRITSLQQFTSKLLLKQYSSFLNRYKHTVSTCDGKM